MEKVRVKVKVRRRRGESIVAFACRKKTKKTLIRVLSKIAEEKKDLRKHGLRPGIELDHELQEAH